MRKPWNAVDEVIYSLVTKDPDHGFNANICTYVTPISRKPKKYLIALDPTTKTHDNFLKTGEGILHILSQSQKPYVRKFGKKTGHDTDKNKVLQKTGEEWMGYPILPEARTVMKIKTTDRYSPSDCDHSLFIVEIEKWSYLNPKAKELTTGDIF